MDAVTVVVALVAVGMSGIYLYDRRTGAIPKVGAADTTSVAVNNWAQLVADGHRIGPAAATLTVVEFGDFECPACGSFEREMRKVRAAHPDEVALIFRHWPLAYHRFAEPAARAAECAGAQGKFAEFHDSMFGTQDSLGLIPFTKIAERIGVPDVARFDACSRASTPEPTVTRDAAVALTVGGLGTPTLIVNGLRLGVPPDSARLESMLREARAKQRGRSG